MGRSAVQGLAPSVIDFALPRVSEALSTKLLKEELECRGQKLRGCEATKPQMLAALVDGTVLLCQTQAYIDFRAVQQYMKSELPNIQVKSKERVESRQENKRWKREQPQKEIFGCRAFHKVPRRPKLQHRHSHPSRQVKYYGRPRANSPQCNKILESINRSTWSRERCNSDVCKHLNLLRLKEQSKKRKVNQTLKESCRAPQRAQEAVKQEGHSPVNETKLPTARQYPYQIPGTSQRLLHMADVQRQQALIDSLDNMMPSIWKQTMTNKRLKHIVWV